MTRVATLALCALAALGACNKKPARTGPPPEVTGLAAVPASAQVVIGADVGKLARSPIIARAIEQLLLRDPTLADRWANVVDSCKIDLPKQIEHIMLALGPPTTTAGSGAVLMVATGKVSEADLASCVRTMVGKGGGSLTSKAVDGRTLYLVKDGNRAMHFGFGRPDTIVLGTDEAWVREGLSTNPKAKDNPELMKWLTKIDQRAPLFAVGKVDERVGAGLVRSGKLAKGPRAFVATLDPTNGAKLLLGVVMPDAPTAKQLESFAKTELLLVSGVAQWKGMGTIVNKINVSTVDDQVTFSAALTMDDVNSVLSALDEPTAPEQIAPPPQ
jgi:hypothetical protein